MPVRLIDVSELKAYRSKMFHEIKFPIVLFSLHSKFVRPLQYI